MAAEKKKTEVKAKKKEPAKKGPAKKKVTPAKKQTKAVVEKKVEKLPEEKALSEEALPAPVAEKKEAAEEKKPEAPSAAKKEKKPKKRKPIEKIKMLPSKELPILAKKKKKPRFIRQEFYKLKRLAPVWRKSRGIDSKKHEGVKGKGETPKPGYGNAKELRGMHPTGFFPILVRNIADLEKVDPSKEAAIIAASIGRAKRNIIIVLANKKNITILNPRKGERR